MSGQVLSQLKDQLEFMERVNILSPFPYFDTGDLEILRNTIKEMENTQHDYDKEPVVACKNCKSLHIVVDDIDNSICMRCNSINELVEFEDIYAYKREKNIWNED